MRSKRLSRRVDRLDVLTLLRGVALRLRSFGAKLRAFPLADRQTQLVQRHPGDRLHDCMRPSRAYGRVRACVRVRG
jgi:hypothetical protein